MPSQRYRPAAEYDDATLAQKREYWRTKKREQRARLAETAPPRGASGDTAPWPAPGPSTRSLKQLQTSLGRSPASAESGAATRWLPAGGAASRPVTSVKPCGAQESPAPSVPPVRATGNTVANGGVSDAAMQPRVSMQGPAASKAQPRGAHGAPCRPPSPPAARANTNANTASGPRSSVRAQPQVRLPDASPHSGTHCAFISSQDAGTSTARPVPPSTRPAAPSARPVPTPTRPASPPDEQQAARRRELWRIKKREQRAKLAARVRARQPAPTVGKPQGPEPGPNSDLNPLQSSLKVSRQNLGPSGVRPPFNDRTQTWCRKAQPHHNQQAAKVKTPHPHGEKAVPSAPSRRLPVLSCLSRGLARCRTPRQRLMEAQKGFLCSRITRGKALPRPHGFRGVRSAPQAEPGDTPERILAKRREYWRLKKREQRAKLSMEVKARLKEKDSLMRRVKRYQKILEDLRRARAQACGAPLRPDAIGGFIKEDGTVTRNLPEALPTSRSNEMAAEGSSGRQLQSPGVTAVAAAATAAPPPLMLRPAQVKVSRPAATTPLSCKPPKLQLLKPRSQLEQTLTASGGSQLTLTLPPEPRNAANGGPNGRGGCVMKMAVSGGSPAAPGEAAPTEDERMAKKREYWRVKKREQRAARAARLKLGVLQARASIALHRRKCQKAAAGSPAPRQGTLTVAGAAPEVAVKQESESVESKPEPEPDPPPGADSQSATLLAVASMKKLLEESLSSVGQRSKSESGGISCKTEAEDVCAELDDAPSKADAGPRGSAPKPPAPAPSATRAAPSELRPSSSSLRRTQRLRAPKGSHQHCCSPEPPRLHHPPCRVHLHQQAPGPGPAPGPGRQQAQRPGTAAGGAGLSSLQRKREYWKLMKRQQRARLKARLSRGPVRHTQAPHLAQVLQAESTPSPAPSAVPSIPTILVVSPPPCGGGGRVPDTLQVKPAVTSVPSPGGADPPGPPHLSGDFADGDDSVASLLGNGADHAEVPVGDEVPAGVRRWASEASDSTDADSALSLPALEPPENPLTSIALQSPDLAPAPDRTQSPVHVLLAPASSPAKLVPVSTMVPPKPIPGEAEEDFMKRKREYWRVKKKEQRARKAIQDKELSHRKAPNHWRPGPPASGPDLQAVQQDSGRWADSPGGSRPLTSVPLDTGMPPFPYPAYRAPLEDESDLGFSSYEAVGGEDEPVSGGVWRNIYLMDYDPLNQLLVCMVCGELQYSHSLEGVRAHIEDAHPDTLRLEAAERRRILEAWDEQVSRRERFFTSQLQQHGHAMTESHRN